MEHISYNKYLSSTRNAICFCRSSVVTVLSNKKPNSSDSKLLRHLDKRFPFSTTYFSLPVYQRPPPFFESRLSRNKTRARPYPKKGHTPREKKVSTHTHPSDLTSLRNKKIIPNQKATSKHEQVREQQQRVLTVHKPCGYNKHSKLGKDDHSFSPKSQVYATTVASCPFEKSQGKTPSVGVRYSSPRYVTQGGSCLGSRLNKRKIGGIRRRES